MHSEPRLGVLSALGDEGQSLFWIGNKLED
jgi:hypothetical protein